MNGGVPRGFNALKLLQSSGLSAVEAPPRISVVIPCFNHGCYIHDAVASVRSQTLNEYEIIVVDDGSTDSLTRRVLDELVGGGIRVFRTINQGLAAARNTGILQACGDYILPLDADDRIAHRFLELAVDVLDSNPDVGVVYGKVEFFGEAAGVWLQPDYSPTRILFENMIVASAMFRRTDWLLIGGYRQGMRHGWEDWDFWLSFVELGRTVVKLPEVMFFYWIRKNSMTRTMSYKKKMLMLLKLVSNHKKLYTRYLVNFFDQK
jgi:glycosyltransferase involved in cell wall biosynthesis